MSEVDNLQNKCPYQSILFCLLAVLSTGIKKVHFTYLDFKQTHEGQNIFVAFCTFEDLAATALLSLKIWQHHRLCKRTQSKRGLTDSNSLQQLVIYFKVTEHDHDEICHADRIPGAWPFWYQLLRSH